MYVPLVESTSVKPMVFKLYVVFENKKNIDLNTLVMKYEEDVILEQTRNDVSRNID